MSENKEYYVKADSLFIDNAFIRNKYLHIKDGVFYGITDEHLLRDNIKVLNYTGHSLSPCFCDYHLHFSTDSTDETFKIARALNSSGIIKVFEGGNNHLSGLNAKKLLRGRLNIQTAGYAIYKKGTYGKHIGKGVSGLQEALDLINKLREDGADYIKIIHSGIFEPKTGKISSGGFEFHELKEIIRHAKSKGLNTACHANGERAVREAVEAGADYIVHGLYINEESLSLMAEKEICFIPTVQAFSSLEVIAAEEQEKINIKKTVDNHLEAIKSAANKGVKVLPGSDSGPSFIPYGKAYIKELELFLKAGFSIGDILSSAASGPLKIGARADFIILDRLIIKKIFISGVCIEQY